jgi:hypothetical protein
MEQPTNSVPLLFGLAFSSSAFTALCVALIFVTDFSAVALIIIAGANSIGAVLTGIGTMQQRQKRKKEQNNA